LAAAEALASYARQADDDSLRQLADRIQARAVRRCVELAKAFNAGPNGGRPKENGEGTLTVSRREAAKQAGFPGISRSRPSAWRNREAANP
jgi:hypothetical protein